MSLYIFHITEFSNFNLLFYKNSFQNNQTIDKNKFGN